MPLYEYRCNDCSAVFELLRPMADREVAAVCPSCESRASMPLISRVAVHAGAGSDASPVDRRRWWGMLRRQLRLRSQLTEGQPAATAGRATAC